MLDLLQHITSIAIECGEIRKCSRWYEIKIDEQEHCPIGCMDGVALM